MTAPHPAKWSDAVLDAIGDTVYELLGDDAPMIFDPFAGVGIERLAKAIGLDDALVLGVELEPEWLPDGGDMIRANTLQLPVRRHSMDAMVTSCAYGNRMADSHEARDPCKACRGEGTHERLATPEEVDAGCELGVAFDECKACRGSGLSKRNTYTHTLGRKPHPASSTTMQWGRGYRDFHEAAWSACNDAIKPGGLAVLNVSNHIRDGREQHVAEWHLNTWMMLGARVHHVQRVSTPRQGFGQNGQARVDGELVLFLQTRPA